MCQVPEESNFHVDFWASMPKVRASLNVVNTTGKTDATKTLGTFARAAYHESKAIHVVGSVMGLSLVQHFDLTI